MGHVESIAKADKKRVRYLSSSEYQKTLSYCEEWLKSIVEVAAWTGLRQANILTLRKSEVDLQARCLTKDREVMKNDENLVIPIAQPAYEVLVESINKTPKDCPYVFPYKGGTYYRVKVERAFRKALKAAGISDFKFHDLLKTLFWVMEQAGWT